jgi:hypothetical protein
MIPSMLQWEVDGGYFMIFEEACRLKTEGKCFLVNIGFGEKGNLLFN